MTGNSGVQAKKKQNEGEKNIDHTWEGDCFGGWCRFEKGLGRLRGTRNHVGLGKPREV